MLKKLFALILVAFFVFGGAPQTVPVAFAGENDSCGVQVAVIGPTGNVGGFTSSSASIPEGGSLKVRISNFIMDDEPVITFEGNTLKLWTTPSNGTYNFPDFPQGNGSGTNTFEFSIPTSEINSLFTGNKRNEAQNLEFVWSNGVGKDVLCKLNGKISYGGLETCDLNAVATKTATNDIRKIYFKAQFRNFNPNTNYMVVFTRDKNAWPAGAENKATISPLTYGSLNGQGLVDGEFGQFTTPNAFFTLNANGGGGHLVLGSTQDNTFRTFKEICNGYMDFSTSQLEVSGEDVVDKAIAPVPKEQIAKFTLCGQIPEGTPQRKACEDCSDSDEDGRPTGIYSAIGCIPVDEKGFLRQMIQLLLSVSGMIALLSILAGAFLLSTSQGDANQVKKAKELITAAVSGLLFIIFSTIILDFIGVQILRIPGLS